MANGPPRALIDTNIWISATIKPAGPPSRVFTALREGRFVPVVSRLLLDEIIEVLDRPRLRRLRRMNDADLATLLVLLEDRVIEVLLAGDLHLCRDPEDDFLLETAIRGGARFVVSRDDDLKRDLDLIAYLQERRIEVVSIAQFLRLLATRPT